MLALSRKQLFAAAFIELMIALSAFLFFVLFFRMEEPSLREYLVVGSGALFFLVGAAMMSAILLRSAELFVTLWLVGAGWFIIFFGWSPLFLLAVALLLAGVLWFYNIVGHEYRVRTELSLFFFFRKGTAILMTGVALLVASSYYASPRFSVPSFEIKIPRVIFDRVAMPIFQSQIEDMLRASSESPGFDISALTESQKTILESQFGVQISTAEEIRQALYETVNKTVNDIINKSPIGGKSGSPLIFVGGIFLVVRAALIPFGWLMAAICAGIARLLIKMGFIGIKKIQIEKETLII